MPRSARSRLLSAPLRGLRIERRPAGAPAPEASDEAVTLSLSTAILDSNCDMLLNARVSGSQMQGTLRLGRCDSQGEHVAEVRLNRR